MAVDRVDRRLDPLQCIESIRMYLAAQGRLPARLEDLVDAPAPLDPMTGRPFDYWVECRRAYLLRTQRPTHLAAFVLRASLRTEAGRLIDPLPTGGRPMLEILVAFVACVVGQVPQPPGDDARARCAGPLRRSGRPGRRAVDLTRLDVGVLATRLAGDRPPGVVAERTRLRRPGRQG